MNKIEELVNKIKYHATNYYNGESEISDSEFDKLVEELRELDPINPILNTVGWGAKLPATGQRVEHSFFVGGLDKIKFSKQTFQNFLFKIWDDQAKAVVSCKLDGISAVAYYEDGNLVNVLTRGDGNTGIDIIAAATYSGTIPKTIGDKSISWVRGEMVVPLGKARELGFSNDRNYASGLARSLETTSEHNNLKFVAYDCSNGDITSIRPLGFNVVRYTIIPNMSNEDLDTFWDEVLSVLYDYTSHDINYEYLVDGMVISSIGGSAYRKAAIKFKNEEYTAVVDYVERNVSPRGRINPVIVLEKPIIIDGVSISRVSGHNELAIKNAGISKGAIITICRANEVIPHWTSTISPGIDGYQEIKTFNGTPVVWHEPFLYLESSDKMYDVIFAMIESKSPKGVAKTKINTLIEEFALINLADLKSFIDPAYDNVIKLKLKSVFSETYYPYMIELLENMRAGWTLAQLLEYTYTLGLGEEYSKVIEKYFKTQDNLLSYLLNNNGILPNDIAVNCTVRSNIPKNLTIITAILSCKFPTYIEEEPNVIVKYNIAITGSLSKPRREIMKEWSKFGVRETPITDADYLIADKPSSSSKYRTAENRGIRIVTEEEFDAILNSH